MLSISFPSYITLNKENTTRKPSRLLPSKNTPKQGEVFPLVSPQSSHLPSSPNLQTKTKGTL